MTRLTDPGIPRITYDLTIAKIDGKRAMVALPVVPENAPYAVREGIARRRITALGGRCPCGAEARLAGSPIGLAVDHDSGCPAMDSRLIKAARRWLA